MRLSGNPRVAGISFWTYSADMGRGRIQLATGIAALAAAALLSAGCGGGGALSLDPVAAAATKTQSAGAAKVRFAMTMNVEGHTIALHAKGIVDGTSADLTFDFGSLFGGLGMPSGAGGGAAGQLAHASMEEIMLDQGGDFVMYMRLPRVLAAQIPGGKRWVELDFSKLGTLHGINFNQLMSSGGMDPSDMLGMLKSEGATVTKLGPATVDGTATTRYGVTIDTAKAYQAKGLTSPLFSRIAAKMPTIPVDVWVGKDGLVRRVRVAMTMPQGVMLMTMDMSDYGVNATIAAPPSGSVFDMTSLVAKQTH